MPYFYVCFICICQDYVEGFDHRKILPFWLESFNSIWLTLSLSLPVIQRSGLVITDTCVLIETWDAWVNVEQGISYWDEHWKRKIWVCKKDLSSAVCLWSSPNADMWSTQILMCESRCFGFCLACSTSIVAENVEQQILLIVRPLCFITPYSCLSSVDYANVSLNISSSMSTILDLACKHMKTRLKSPDSDKVHPSPMSRSSAITSKLKNFCVPLAKVCIDFGNLFLKAESQCVDPALTEICCPWTLLLTCNYSIWSWNSVACSTNIDSEDAVLLFWDVLNGNGGTLSF